MKAVIMAGGEGTRLRPITSNCPKPMVKLIDKPVLEHILMLLKKNGIDDVCVTLKYLPEQITEYFKNKEHLHGIKMTSRVEKEPLGTAGGVKACSDFINGEDFIVISGDGVCSIDLKSCIKFHKERNADVTIVMCRHPEPGEYGVIVTASDGRILRFVEKPAWDNVFTNTVNTGIYIISPEILAEIPDEGSYDFSRDLFPKLLDEGKKLFGVLAEGYWCDIGSPKAYLKCSMDALDGLAGVSFEAPEARDGVWSKTPLEGLDVKIVPPVYIGEDVELEPGAEIGPHAVIGSGSRIGSEAVIKSSVINGAQIRGRADVDGSVIGNGTYVGERTRIEEGTTVGENVRIGKNAKVTQGVKIWSERDVPDDAVVSENLVSGILRGEMSFTAPGTIAGQFNIELTPETCVAVGAAVAQYGRVGISWSGSEASRVLAEAIACGICSAGGKVTQHDASTEASACFAGGYFGFPISVHVELEDGDRAVIRVFGTNGMSLGREKERKIESAARGEFKRAAVKSVGTHVRVTGLLEAYTSAAIRAGALGGASGRGIQVSVSGRGAENRLLRQTLEKFGCTVTDKKHGIPCFSAEKGGFDLTIEDEKGTFINAEKTLVLAALIGFERGIGRIAVPYSAPVILDVLADGFGSQVMRLGKDGDEALILYQEQMFLRDAAAMAVRIVSMMSASGESVFGAAARLPRFSSVYREIELTQDRGSVMRQLVSSYSEMASELIEGLKVDTGTGWLHIIPSSRRQALIVRTECKSEELAEELCADIERKVKEIGDNK